MMGLPAAPLGAEPTTPETPEDAARTLEQQKSALEATEKRKSTLQKDLQITASEQEELNKRLIETAALVQKSEGQLTTIEGRLAELAAQEKLVRGSLDERQDRISSLLMALQRMGRNPPPVMITRREDALAMVRSAMLLAKAFPGMREQAQELSGKLTDLVGVMDNIRGERDKLKTETDRLTATRTQLAGLMSSKKQTFAERQQELAKVREASAEISRNVKDLNELIDKLGATAATRPEAGPADPAADAKTTVAAVDASKTAPDAAPLAATTPPEKPEKHQSVVELAPAGTSLIPGSAGRMKPSLPFDQAKQKLPLPAQGRRVLSFGDKTQYGGASKGVVIETRQSAQVTSPCDGWIVYAGEFRSYGQLLIIDPGGGYHVLVAGMSAIDVQPGQFVLAAEPVGTMSGPPRTAQLSVQQATSGVNSDAASPNSPVLYIEFRKDGQPIDPDPWWVAQPRKVQD